MKSRSYELFDNFLPDYLYNMIRYVAFSSKITLSSNPDWSKNLYAGENVLTNRVLNSDPFYLSCVSYFFY